jgi:hypothetical protein
VPLKLALGVKVKEPVELFVMATVPFAGWDTRILVVGLLSGSEQTRVPVPTVSSLKAVKEVVVAVGGWFIRVKTILVAKAVTGVPRIW